MKENIVSYFNTFNFDIRQSHSNRFMDQKVTPDVLCIVADCLLKYLENKQDDTIEFTSKDLWHFDYSNENIQDIFGKPDLMDTKAISEYNKFFHQPLKALSYANILSERTKDGKGNTLFFSLKNKEILEYISIKERNSLEFINIYLEKVLKDSEIWSLFDNFFNNNIKDNFNILKSDYEEFIRTHTPTNNKEDIRRIFTKIINPLSFTRKKNGTSKGRFSQDIIARDDLMYNRKNWRDVAKKKGETRENYEERAKSEFKISNDAYVKYNINKAKNIIKRLHIQMSEVSDEFENGEATQIHHIFMKSEYPKIATFIENLILLTPTQHFTKAHPHNNTSIVNKDYQLLCLLAKSDSIQTHYNTYSKEDFLFVLKIGLNVKFTNNIEFEELKEELVKLYHTA